jgi:putative intracellular protease/amidase
VDQPGPVPRQGPQLGVCRGFRSINPQDLINRTSAEAGKTWTGFANSEEAFADSFVGKRIQPFWIEEEARKIDGTNFIVNGMFKPFAVRDGNLITGQQQNSGAVAAALVMETLGS